MVGVIDMGGLGLTVSVGSVCWMGSWIHKYAGGGYCLEDGQKLIKGIARGIYNIL